MTKRIIQLELAARRAGSFAVQAGKLNQAAVDMARAQRERHHSAMALAWRITRSTSGLRLA